ncbi:Uncharacterized protein FWK35_00026842 [Aphis craccivora]|uniref:Uncharacterized protein n=1 Tax=Aphis craccivora TaxID=307492 RepID=A0A6G0VVG3_APHCR|nr:Uncharacterized protein FWK35_00026842 [Aphis craccivora]
MVRGPGPLTLLLSFPVTLILKNPNILLRHFSLLTNKTHVVGPSGCGKTNLIYALLTNINGVRFHNVYIYSKTLDQP